MNAPRPTRTPPREVHASVASARRRLGVSMLVTQLAPAMAIGGGVAALLVVAVKVFGARLGLGQPGWMGWTGVVACPILLAGSWAILAVRRRWPSVVAAASVLDEASDTHDLLGSSLEIASRLEIGFFERQTISEAELAASRAATKDVGQLVYGPRWVVGVGSIAMAALLAWLAPMREPSLPGPAPIVRMQSPEAISAAADKVASAKEALETALSTGQINQQELAAVEELERELSEGLREPEEAVAAAAESLQRSADEAAKRAQREQARSEALRERLASIDPERFGEAQELAQDLTEGDFEGAASEAERLLEQMKSAPAEEQQKLANELRRLAEEIERQQQESQGAETSEPEPQESEQPDPVEQEPPTEPLKPEEIKEQLEREGVAPEDAERLAREIHDEQQRERESEQAEQEARDEAKRVAEELRREADKLSPPEEKEEQQGQGEPTEQQEQQPGEQDQSQPGDQGQQRPQPSNSDQAGEQGQGEQPKQGSESEAEQRKQQSGDQQGEGESEQKEGESKEGQPEQGGQEKEGQQPTDSEGGEQGQPSDAGTPKPGQEPGQESGQQPGQQPGEQPGSQPGSEPGEGAQQQEGMGDGDGQGQSPGLGETLRRMAEQRQRAEDAGNSARDLQRRADELTGQAPGMDAQRDAAERFAPDAGWEGQTEFVDARTQDEADPERENIIAEWFNPSAKPGEAAKPGQIDPSQSVQQAEQRAQRALEQQAVPRRHADLIKRVFDRYGERAQQAAPKSTAPPTDAKDAP